MTSLRITHSHGFFSCCSVRLEEIVRYFNKHAKLPDNVDSSEQFGWYKVNNPTQCDITFQYFEKYDIGKIKAIDYTMEVDYNENYQFSDYSTLKYADLTPFIEKYFSPSIETIQSVEDLEVKYTIDYKNICVLFYRGNDKITETQLGSYEEYIVYAQERLNQNPNVRFLIQSDETEFIETMTAVFPTNSFYMNDEIRHMRKCNNTVDKVQTTDIDKYSRLYLAITIIISKCEYVVCGSGNCSIWIMFYRGSNKNVHQNINGRWT